MNNRVSVLPRHKLKDIYSVVPCPKCQAVGDYQFRGYRITCMNCGRYLKEF